MTEHYAMGHDRQLFDRPLGTYLVLFALFYSPFMMVVYPAVTVGLFAGILLFTAGLRFMKAYIGRKPNRSGSITIPGVGTVEYRITR